MFRMFQLEDPMTTRSDARYALAHEAAGTVALAALGLVAGLLLGAHGVSLAVSIAIAVSLRYGFRALSIETFLVGPLPVIILFFAFRLVLAVALGVVAAVIELAAAVLELVRVEIAFAMSGARYASQL